MIEFNRILLQLDKAVNCANSPHPQDKGTAVILFDNLIEVQLYKRAELIFIVDRTTWYGGNRQFDKNIRKEAASKEGKYEKLLKFSKTQKLLSEADVEILKYVHTIRNAVYHRGDLDRLKLDLAIIIYYGFLSKKLKKWGSPSWLHSHPSNYPGNGEIEFGQGLSSEDFSFDFQKYYAGALDAIFGRLKIAHDLSTQATSIVNAQIKGIKKSLDFINTESRTINFYSVLGRYWYLNGDFFEYYARKRKPKNIDSILILYSFLRQFREYLDDIPDLMKRQKEGKTLLKKYRNECKGKYRHWTDLDRIIECIRTFKNKDGHAIMKSLMNIEDKLSLLYADSAHASSDLDVYIQDMVDAARGK